MCSAVVKWKAKSTRRTKYMWKIFDAKIVPAPSGLACRLRKRSVAYTSHSIPLPFFLRHIFDSRNQDKSLRLVPPRFINLAPQMSLAGERKQKECILDSYGKQTLISSDVIPSDLPPPPQK